jgi:plasmid stabilization system protein ParE
VKYRVVVSPRARDDLRRLSEWWALNRPDSPGLLVDEFEDVAARVSEFPRVGPRYDRGETECRRMLMPQTQNHVYYTIVRDEVRIIAVWGAVRGRGPKL